MIHLLHSWTPWSKPKEERLGRETVMVQYRFCKKCNKTQKREVISEHQLGKKYGR